MLETCWIIWNILSIWKKSSCLLSLHIFSIAVLRGKLCHYFILLFHFHWAWRWMMDLTERCQSFVQASFQHSVFTLSNIFIFFVHILRWGGTRFIRSPFVTWAADEIKTHCSAPVRWKGFRNEQLFWKPTLLSCDANQR